MDEVEDDGDGKVMCHGKHPDDAIIGADTEEVITGCYPSEKGVVREDDAFAFTGGARAESNEGRVELFEFPFGKLWERCGDVSLETFG